MTTDVHLVLAFAILAYCWVALSRWLARTSGGASGTGTRPERAIARNRVKHPAPRAGDRH